MQGKKKIDQAEISACGVEPSGYIHPDNARRLLDGETVAFRKKPYGHDGGGIPVFVGTSPVSAEPILRIGTDSNGELAIFTPRFNSVIARFTPCGKSGMKEGLLYAAPVAAQAQQVDRSTEMQGNPVDKPLDLQGHASVIFSKAVAWADARVDAALIQPEQEGYGSACDDAAQTHYELVLALRDLQQAQQPVSGADGLDERAEFEKAWTSYPGRKTPIRFDDGEYQYPAANTAWKFWQARAALAQQDTLQAEVLDMVRMLEANEWADHCGKSELGQRLEWAITALQNRISELTKSSSQQDADKVDAERYQAWRDALITGKTAEDDFIRLVADSLPTSVGVSRRPTAAEWDAAIDAARKEQA